MMVGGHELRPAHKVSLETESTNTKKAHVCVRESRWLCKQSTTGIKRTAGIEIKRRKLKGESHLEELLRSFILFSYKPWRDRNTKGCA